MKQFNYQAKNQQGQHIKGVIETTDEKHAAKILRNKGYVVVSLSEKSSFKLFAHVDFLNRITSKDISVFTRQLGVMIKTGLTLTDALNILKKQAKPKLEGILENIVEEIESGSSFYGALKPHQKVFSKTYLALVRSGEESGKLDEVLVRLADNLEKKEDFKGKIKGALIYPAIVLIGMGVVAFIMMVFVVPKLTSMYEDFGVSLPLPTRILIAVSNFMSNFWYVFFIMLGLGIFLFRKWRQTKEGKAIIDKWLLKFPVVGDVIKKSVLTQLAQTMSMLIDAGVPIIDTLEIVAETSNNYIFEVSILEVAERLEKGVPLATSFSTYSIYPPLFIQMLSVGEETGKLGEVLKKVSYHFEMETETAIKGLTSSMEPLMMVVLGIGVGFLVISIITPIYQLTSSF